jgi:hypothetical protein
LREVILWGGDDEEEGLCGLIRAGILLVKPEPGQRDWFLSDVMDGRRFLQRELVCPESVMNYLAGPDAIVEPRQRHFVLEDLEVTDTSMVVEEQLWRNILHLHACLDGDALMLNRDGTPNRRSLLRFARVLELPGHDVQDIDEALEGRLMMLLTLSISMGILEVDGHTLSANVDVGRSLFGEDEVSRNRLLLKGWRTNRLWREDHSMAEGASEGRPSLTLEGGKFAGSREQVIEDLRALELSVHWCDLEAVAEILARLDRGFIAQAVDVTPLCFVRAILEVGLFWHGWIVLGKTAEGRTVFRLTPSGQRLFSQIELNEEAPMREPSLVVQPNMEVTVFLQDVSLADLYMLQQVGDRKHLSDHTAIYEVVALRTQRAYSRDLTADELIAFLEKNGRTPLPDNVVFVLKDWQRVQKKVTMYTTGALLQYPDPDKLDSMQDNLTYGTKPPLDIRRMALGAIFLPGSDGRPLGRVLDFDSLHRVDYAATPSVTLEHVEGLKLVSVHHGLDIVTMRILEVIAEESPEGWTLDIDKIKACWKESPADEIIDFLNPRLDGGIKPKLEIELRARIAEISASVYESTLVVALEDEFIVRRLLEIHGVDEMITARLGTRALLVAPGHEGAIKTLLADLGLVGEPVLG